MGLTEKQLLEKADRGEVISLDDLYEPAEEADKAWEKIMDTYESREKISANRRLKIYEENMLSIFKDAMFAHLLLSQASGCVRPQNDGKRWCKEENDKLIEMASISLQDNGDYETLIMAAPHLFGRKPSSVRNQLSKLVGIERLTVKVEGKFEGDFEGEAVKGQISGLVHKK